MYNVSLALGNSQHTLLNQNAINPKRRLRQRIDVLQTLKRRCVLTGIDGLFRFCLHISRNVFRTLLINLNRAMEGLIDLLVEFLIDLHG